MNFQIYQNFACIVIYVNEMAAFYAMRRMFWTAIFFDKNRRLFLNFDFEILLFWEGYSNFGALNYRMLLLLICQNENEK